MKRNFSQKAVLLSVVVAAIAIGIAVADTAAPVKLTGKPIGTKGSYQNSGNTIDKAFDGDINTFVDADESTNGNGCWVGLDLDKPAKIVKIRYAPRFDFPDRMIGGKFEGSTTSDFAKPVLLASITASPEPGKYVEVTKIASDTPFKYVRYCSPDDGWNNISELEFYTNP